jgi:hypothetical protein
MLFHSFLLKFHVCAILTGLRIIQLQEAANIYILQTKDDIDNRPLKDNKTCVYIAIVGVLSDIVTGVKECVHDFHMILRINSDYFPKQH